MILVLGRSAILTGRLWQTRVRHCPKLFKQKENEPEKHGVRDKVVIVGHAKPEIAAVGSSRVGRVETETREIRLSS